jgi:hypothetical protein
VIQCPITWPANGTTLQCSRPYGHKGQHAHQLTLKENHEAAPRSQS